ncbi:hypothetical protein [Nannocystis pusilla]|uniref:Uncharacterized protein n=1 Tax=Nannocystis pusilla TaxID=889268 RepID=A0ABS7TXK9_9BACT|nr:hypothetical protein [Nannocystis pusilla]MBZ5712992.1 hypothetical protein [Nannocystis pusilla]
MSLAVLQNGWLASCCEGEGEIDIWDLSPANPLKSVRTLGLFSTRLSSLAALPDGRLVGNCDGAFLVYDKDVGEGHFVHPGLPPDTVMSP